jgi:Outer membrane protein beta-barrel domain
MKKNVLLYISVLLFSVLSFGQAPRGFYFKGFMNSTSIKSDYLIADPGIGYGAGINFNMGYHETYNYQMEILFNQQYASFKSVDSNTLDNLHDSKQKFSSVQVGLYFNYYILKPDEDKFFLGPQVGVATSFAGSFEPVDQKPEGELYLPYLLSENDFKLNPPEVVVSTGIGLTGGYNNFRFDLRYELGLSNIMKNVQLDNYDEYNIYRGPTLDGKMNTITFGISYKLFFFKKK